MVKNEKTGQVLMFKKIIFNPFALAFWFVLPVFGVVFFIHFFSINFPVSDDWNVFEVLAAMDQNSGAVVALFKSRLEHRPVLARLFCLLDYGVFGSLNFKRLIWCSNVLFLGGILGIFYYIFRSLGQRFIYFLPVSMLLFQGKLATTMIWYWGVLQYSALLFLALSSLYLLTFKTGFWSRLLALLLSIAGIFSIGAGVFLPFVLVMVLLIQKEFKTVWLYAVCFSVVLGFYFWDLELKPQQYPSNIWAILLSAMAFANAFWLIPTCRLLSNFWLVVSILVLGLPLLGYFVWQTKHFFNALWAKKSLKTIQSIHFFGIAFFVFVGVVAVATSLRRTDANHIGDVLNDRYELFSCVLTIVVYLGLLASFERKKRLIAPIFFGLALIFNLVFSLRQIQIETHSMNTKYADMFNYFYYNSLKTPYLERSATIFSDFEYILSNLNDPKNNIQKSELEVSVAQKILPKGTVIQQYGKIQKPYTWHEIKLMNESQNNARWFALLQGDKPFLIAFRSNFLSAKYLKNYINNTQNSQLTTTADVYPHKLVKKGIYKLYIYQIEGKKHRIFATDSQLKID